MPSSRTLEGLSGPPQPFQSLLIHLHQLPLFFRHVVHNHPQKSRRPGDVLRLEDGRIRERIA